jgi:hypothetical protein
MQPMEQQTSESDSESELDSEEEDIKKWFHICHIQVLNSIVSLNKRSRKLASTRVIKLIDKA